MKHHTILQMCNPFQVLKTKWRPFVQYQYLVKRAISICYRQAICKARDINLLLIPAQYFVKHAIPICMYRLLDPRWSIGRPQLFSTGFCPGRAGRSIWIHCRPICGSVRLIFSNCFSAYHGFVYLEDSKKVLFRLRCYAVSLVYGRSFSTSFFWFGSSSSLLGFLLVGLRCWWCSAILPRGCYVGSDLWGQGLDFCRDFLRYSPSFGSVHQDQFYICIEDPKFGPQGYLFRSQQRSQQEKCCSGFANPRQHISFCSSINSYHTP